jgi:hypothetical protein
MHCGCSIAAFQCLEGMDWACKACLLLFMGQLKFVFLFQANLGMGQRNPKDFLSSFSLCARVFATALYARHDDVRVTESITKGSQAQHC